MKYIITLILCCALHADTEFDYNLLLGSWMQKSIAKTNQTGIFVFKPDSTFTIEIHKDDNDAFIGSMQGSYRIKRKRQEIVMTLMGKEKLFHLINLDANSLIIKNVEENKEQQTFERYLSTEKQ